MTTQAQIDYVQSLAAELQKLIPYSNQVKVNDWNHYSSFSVYIIFPATQGSRSGGCGHTYWFHEEIDFRKVGKIIRKLLETKQVSIEQIVMPKKLYKQIHYGKYPDGYDTYEISLDFTVLIE